MLAVWRKINWEWTVPCSEKCGLAKEFFLYFWDYIKDIYVSSIRTAGIKTEFSVSQKQVIIKSVKKGNL